VDTRTRCRLRIAGIRYGQRLAGAGARLAEQRPAVLDDVGHSGGHPPLAVARLVAVDDAGQRTGFEKDAAT
jgi:hypothetical protein